MICCFFELRKNFINEMICFCLMDDKLYRNCENVPKVLGFNCKRLNILRAKQLENFLKKEVSGNYSVVLDLSNLDFIDTSAFQIIKSFKDNYSTGIIIPTTGIVAELFELKKEEFGNTYERYNSLEEFKQKQKINNFEYYFLNLEDSFEKRLELEKV